MYKRQTYTCSRCGDEYTDHYREATGHDYDIQITEPTCTERGHKNYTCKKCGKTKTEDFKEATGHDYVSVVTAPTCTEKGYTTYSCTKCDYVVTDDYREPLQHNYKLSLIHILICGIIGAWRSRRGHILLL